MQIDYQRYWETTLCNGSRFPEMAEVDFSNPFQSEFRVSETMTFDPFLSMDADELIEVFPWKSIGEFLDKVRTAAGGGHLVVFYPPASGCPLFVPESLEPIVHEHGKLEAILWSAMQSLYPDDLGRRQIALATLWIQTVSFLFGYTDISYMHGFFCDFVKARANQSFMEMREGWRVGFSEDFIRKNLRKAKDEANDQWYLLLEIVTIFRMTHSHLLHQFAEGDYEWRTLGKLAG